MDVAEVIRGFSPESDLEQSVTGSPELVAGLRWGKPRPGHPEGSVAVHVGELLQRIGGAADNGEHRRLLRFVALVHDSFKYQVDGRRPKTGENHHAMRARRFAEGVTRDERLLSTIELHDRPYSLWRGLQLKRRLDEPALQELLTRVPDLDLFARFVELDGSTRGKRSEPLRWWRRELRRRGLDGK